jgi:hypothetical protein
MLRVLTSASGRLPHQPHPPPHSNQFITEDRHINTGPDQQFYSFFFQTFANFSRLQASKCVFLPASETFCDVKSQQENFSLWQAF